jgi:hypothetical protein
MNHRIVGIASHPTQARENARTRDPVIAGSGKARPHCGDAEAAERRERTYRRDTEKKVVGNRKNKLDARPEKGKNPPGAVTSVCLPE